MNAPDPLQSNFPNISSFVLFKLSAASIIRDFSTKQLQEEWDSFLSSVLQRRDERIQKKAAALEATEQQRQWRATERSSREAAVQSALDSLQAIFADESVSLNYDADRLSQKYGLLESVAVNGKPLPCLGERAHWLDCGKKYVQDTRPCDTYLAALERCVVNETIVKTTKSWSS